MAKQRSKSRHPKVPRKRRVLQGVVRPGQGAQPTPDKVLMRQARKVATVQQQLRGAKRRVEQLEMRFMNERRWLGSMAAQVARGEVIGQGGKADADKLGGDA